MCRYVVRINPKRCPDVSGISVRMWPKYAGMTSGLEQNSARVAKRGLTKEFIKKMIDTITAAQSLENEQESLKAKLKEKTAAFDVSMAELTKQLSEAKKVVKLEMPQENCKEFGIEDQR